MAVITGTSDNDVLNGTPGDDTIDGLAGADSMTGGNGNDAYYVDNVDDQVNEQSNGGIDTVFVVGGEWEFAYILPDHVENGTLLEGGPVYLGGNALNNVLIGQEDWWSDLFGEEGNDTLIARNTSDENGSSMLFGGAGNDSLYGNDAGDYLDGDEGRDYMEGGNGGDSYIVDNTGDIVAEFGLNEGEYGDSVECRLTNYTLGDNVEQLSFLPDNRQLDCTGYGNALDNWIGGRSGADRLYGRAGNDIIAGNHDNDRLYGEAGNDTLYGDRHNDQLYGGDGDDVLWGGEDADELYGDAGNDLLNGASGQDRLNGGAGNDVLNGGSGTDVLLGGDGDDQLRSGDGSDTMTGGAGIDRFTINSGMGVDTITDYDANLERIIIDKEDWEFVLELGALGAQYFHAGAGAAAVAQTADHHLIFNTSNGRLYYDYDGTGEEEQFHLATLNIGAGTFDYNDILVVT